MNNKKSFWTCTLSLNYPSRAVSHAQLSICYLRPFLGLPRTRYPLTFTIASLLEIWSSFNFSMCPNHLNTLWYTIRYSIISSSIIMSFRVTTNASLHLDPILYYSAHLSVLLTCYTLHRSLYYITFTSAIRWFCEPRYFPNRQYENDPFPLTVRQLVSHSFGPH